MIVQTDLLHRQCRRTIAATLLGLFLLFGTVALLTRILKAETTKTVYNPFTGKLDFITKIDTGTAYGFLNVQLVDSAGCLWKETVDTAGSFVATQISCPAVAAAFRPCTTGMSLGILLAITCP